MLDRVTSLLAAVSARPDLTDERPDACPRCTGALEPGERLFWYGRPEAAVCKMCLLMATLRTVPDAAYERS